MKRESRTAGRQKAEPYPSISAGPLECPVKVRGKGAPKPAVLCATLEVLDRSSASTHIV